VQNLAIVENDWQMTKLPTTQLIKFAGLFTWVCVGLALLAEPFFGDNHPSNNQYLIWIVAQLSFGIAYWQLASDLESRHDDRVTVMLLGLMTISALEITNVTGSGLGGILLMVIAGMLPWTLPLGQGIAWLVAQNVGLALMGAAITEADWQQVLLTYGFYLGYSSFTFVVSLVARRQSTARDELRKVNSELRATQTLLTQGTRVAERLRISRELHDLVGHHLTALSLNLEVASHLVEGRAKEHVTQAQTVARLLLSDVRDVVSTLRNDEGIDLVDALHSLSEGVARPKIHLEMPGELRIEDPKRAQVILRCTQEIITNSLKHANADHLWLRVEQDENGMSIHARDDGCGTDQLREGNGLMGMGERLRQLGGKLSVQSTTGEGFVLDAWLPKEVSL
jgi:signal transduction histidine kinase